jgi:hypothetical protein
MSVWQSLKPLWQPDLRRVDVLGPLLVSIMVSVLTDPYSDLFAAAGLPIPVPFAGAVLTGIIGGRTANGLHDLLKVLERLKSGQPPLDLAALAAKLPGIIPAAQQPQLDVTPDHLAGQMVADAVAVQLAKHTAVVQHHAAAWAPAASAPPRDATQASPLCRTGAPVDEE